MAYGSVAFVIKSGMWSLTSTSLNWFIAAVKTRDDRYDMYIYVTLIQQLDKFRFGYSVEIATAAVLSYMQCVPVLSYMQCVPHKKFNDVK
jgi:hypothetical protein